MWVHYNPVDLEIDDDNSFVPIHISNSRILVLSSSSMSGMYGITTALKLLLK